ncbi:hypothetical protein MP228_006183 [Amoeboaphelidium protococcarum]|nr:hypothetical protein MP228_006183 [Amoeboaphelidium protococcarum]
MAAAQRALERIGVAAVVLGTGASLVQSSMYDVPGGHRAVIFDRFQGVKKDVINEGTHFLVPWLQRAITYDVRTKPRNISTTTGSKDMQMISLTLRVLHKPDVKRLPVIYQSLGLDYDDRVLPSIGNEVLKAVVAQFDAGELITQREIVSAQIRGDLVKRAKEFNILLEDVYANAMYLGAVGTETGGGQNMPNDAEQAQRGKLGNDMEEIGPARIGRGLWKRMGYSEEEIQRIKADGNGAYANEQSARVFAKGPQELGGMRNFMAYQRGGVSMYNKASDYRDAPQDREKYGPMTQQEQQSLDHLTENYRETQQEVINNPNLLDPSNNQVPWLNQAAPQI